jgi:Cell wall-associated hydrolases (invasion-associated proteins)
MKKTYLFAALFLLAACSAPGPKVDKKLEEIKSISEAVRQQYAPDKRSNIYEVNVKPDMTQAGVYVLRGAISVTEARQDLLVRLQEENLNVLDSTTLLPAADLGEKTYGITTQSVINFRTGPSYASEAATQTMMGMPLRILEKRSGWTRAVTPEGYIAWVSSGGIREMSKAEYEAWTAAEKLIITTHYTLFRDQARANATVVSDGVWGNIVRADGESGLYYRVILPTGLNAFVLKKDAQKLGAWLKQRNPSPQNIIATGKQFIGFPYMWGGTSIKAMDCSGFVKTCYYLHGVIIPRDASQQAYVGENVDISGGIDHLQPGDLLFFGSKATAETKERITHVGIYMEEGEFIHSAGYVHINSLKPEAYNYYSGSTRLVRVQRYTERIGVDKALVRIAEHPWYNQ